MQAPPVVPTLNPLSRRSQTKGDQLPTLNFPQVGRISSWNWSAASALRITAIKTICPPKSASTFGGQIVLIAVIRNADAADQFHDEIRPTCGKLRVGS